MPEQHAARERMKGDLNPAAMRLSSTLPSRTHYAPEHGSSHWRAQQKANHMRPVRINGMVYDSITEAARRIGTHRDAIRKMIHNGEAAYLDGKRKSGRGCRTITYKGQQYAGVMDMMRRLKIAKSTLYKLLDSGQARRD